MILNIPSLPLFEKYPSQQQNLIHSKILDIINETFVFPADSDYITARFLSLNHVHRAFFWPAVQALEKYLKANLLHYGEPVKGFGHDIVAMAKELEKHDHVLKDLTLIPDKMHDELEKLSLWGSTDVNDFLRSIKQFGNTSNRYNYYGSEYKASYLLKLDQVVYALRTNVVGDQVLYDLRKRDSLNYYAYEQNVCFAPVSYQHQTMYGKFGISMSVPSIEAALKGRYGQPHVFERWLIDNIKIKPSEILKIKKRYCPNCEIVNR
jgi:hypothetical protein